MPYAARSQEGAPRPSAAQPADQVAERLATLEWVALHMSCTSTFHAAHARSATYSRDLRRHVAERRALHGLTAALRTCNSDDHHNMHATNSQAFESTDSSMLMYKEGRVARRYAVWAPSSSQRVRFRGCRFPIPTSDPSACLSIYAPHGCSLHGPMWSQLHAHAHA